MNSIRFIVYDDYDEHPPYQSLLPIWEDPQKESLQYFENDPYYVLQEIPGPTLDLLQLNVLKIPLPVRKALQYAFDHSCIEEGIIPRPGFAHHTPILQGTEYYNPNITGLPNFNLTKAREYLIQSSEYGTILHSDHQS